MKISFKNLTFISLFFFAFSSLAAIEFKSDRLNPSQKANLKAQLQSFIAGQKMAGLVVAASVDNEVIWAEGVGVSSVDSQNPIQVDHHLFRWASVSKVYTDVTARYFEEMGVLNRNDTLAKHYTFTKRPTFYQRCFSDAQLQQYGTCIKNYGGAPVLTPPNNNNCFDVTDFSMVSTTKNFRAIIQDQSTTKGRIAFVNLNDNVVRCSAEYGMSLQTLSDNSSQISLKMLLDHTSGIQHYEYLDNRSEPAEHLLSDKDFVQKRVTEKKSHMEWAISSFFPTLPLLNRPGYAYSYSTFGYNLAGVVIENASSMKFHDFMKSMNVKIGSPSLQEDLFQIPPRGGFQRVQTHEMLENQLKTNPYTTDNSYKLAGGGIISNVVDLAKFCAAVATPNYFTTKGLSGYTFSGAHPGRSLAHLALQTVGGKRQCVVLMTNTNHSNVNLPSIRDALRLRLKSMGFFN